MGAVVAIAVSSWHADLDAGYHVHVPQPVEAAALVFLIAAPAGRPEAG